MQADTLEDARFGYTGSAVNPVALPEFSTGGFLQELERREDLQWLCVRLVSDALHARAMAESRDQNGDSAEAVRCRAAARKAARHAARFLEEYRRSS